MSKNSILNIEYAANYFDNLETKNNLIDEKKYKDLVIYFKSIKILNLHYHELIGNIEEHEEKKK